jgi:hypothetical protein
LLPLVHLRAGSLQEVFVEVNYGHRFPSFTPSNEFELLMGVYAKQGGHTVRFGTSMSHFIVVRPDIRLNPAFHLEPYVGIFGSWLYGKGNGFQGGLNLHYRINQEE